MKETKSKKKWIPKEGDNFYFIYPSDILTSEDKYYVDLNSGDYLVIGDAAVIDVQFESACNCFKTKRLAINALKEIKKILAFTGEA